MSEFGINEDAKRLILAGIRQSTTKQYCSYINKWLAYCRAHHVHYSTARGSDVINFLASLYSKGLGYSAINTARAALSNVLPASVKASVFDGTNSLACRLLKGVFNKRPSLPRYTITWNPDIVLSHLESLKLDTICLKSLTLKLTMLLALCSAQRLQGLRALSVHNCVIQDGVCTFYIDKLLKTTKYGRHQQPIRFSRFHNRELCVVAHIERYMTCTKSFRNGANQLLLSYVKPHKPVCEDSISRWLKTVLRQSGVDITQFSAHSTRSASTSKVQKMEGGTSIESILSSAGWARDSTFRKFYCRDFYSTSETVFSTAVLSKITDT